MITKSEAYTLMKPEIKCQECDGVGNFPPCELHCYAHQSHPCEKCGRLQGICPTCSGKVVIIEDVIMMIIGELYGTWGTALSTCQPSKDYVLPKHIYERFIVGYKEYHLTKALLLLLALADVLEQDLYPLPIDTLKPTENLLFIISMLGSFYPNMPGRIDVIYGNFLYYCKQNSIDIESHIKAYRDNVMKNNTKD